jgi:hypothetical protein
MTQPDDTAHDDVHAGANTPTELTRTDGEGMPRWVKRFLIVAAALVLLVVALMLVSGGQHGPGRHLSSDGLSTQREPLPALTRAAGQPL